MNLSISIVFNRFSRLNWEPVWIRCIQEGFRFGLVFFCAPPPVFFTIMRVVIFKGFTRWLTRCYLLNESSVTHARPNTLQSVGDSVRSPRPIIPQSRWDSWLENKIGQSCPGIPLLLLISSTVLISAQKSKEITSVTFRLKHIYKF